MGARGDQDELDDDVQGYRGGVDHQVVQGRVGARLASCATRSRLIAAHWFGSAGPGAAEVLVLFGPQGERVHVRARPRATALPASGPGSRSG